MPYVISQRCIFFNRQDFISDIKIRNSWFFESICYSRDCTTKLRFVLVRYTDVYQLFTQNLAFPCTNDMSQLYVIRYISQRCISSNRQDFVSDVKMRNSWFFESICYSRDCTTKLGFVLVRYTDVYQLFTQNLAFPCTNDMSQLICHTLYHSNAYLLIGRIS